MSENEAKAKATAMLLRSEYGKPRQASEGSPLDVVLHIWQEVSEESITHPGCINWLKECVTGVDRIAQHWAWIGLPAVLFCSEHCASAPILMLKRDPLECDCCSKARGEKLVLLVGEVAVLTVTCALCAEFPEAFAINN